MEAATNSLPSSHALSLHPGMRGWAELAPWAGKGLLGFILQPPELPSPLGQPGQGWRLRQERWIEVKCPGDTVAGGKLCLNPPGVCGLSLLVY